MNARRHLARAVAPAAFALAALYTGAAPVRAANDPGGYTSRGQLVVSTTFGGAKLTVGGEIATEQRGQLVRVDVLSLGFPGADPTTSALLGTQLFPPGGFTVIVKPGSTYTVWSNAKRAYFTAPLPGSPGAATPAPATTPTPAPTPTGSASPGPKGIPFFKELTTDRAFSLSIALAGHGTTNGHPTTGLAYQLARVAKNGDATDVHGRLEIADDLDGIPVEFTASASGKSIPQTALKIDIVSFTKTTPKEADFEIPAGYTKAASIGDVFGRVLAR